MNTDLIKFKIHGRNVSVCGYPELDGCTGLVGGEGMAFFFGNGRELYIANTRSGKIRKLSTSDGNLLAADSDIDYDAIARECPHGLRNAQARLIRYAGINRWDNFKGGLCAISWMLYPDGRYFADSDGFGMEDNDEEEVYAIIDTNLDFIEPFRPIKDVSAYLKELRKEY